MIITVNLDGPGEGFNDPTMAAPVGGNTGTTIGQQRLIAFQHATNIWASLITSPVEVRVEGNFDPLSCSANSAVLGSAGPNTSHRNFAGAPVPGTWYVQALANSLFGGDLNPGSNDIGARFSSTIGTPGCLEKSGWYYGLDASPPPGKIDFVTVLLHELGHGLGFLTLVNLNTGQKLNGFNDAYMRLLEDHSTGKSYPQMTDAERLAASTNTGNLHWTGFNVIAGSGSLTAGRHPSGHVQMYAPNPAQSGSSVSHYDTALSPNELMEPSYTGPLRDVGLTLELFKDLGWNVSGISLLPEVTIAATDSTATEQGPTTGTLTVTRTGGTTASLIVFYSTGGTVTAGSDYQPLSGSVMIPAGQSSASITITPIDDAVVGEGNETVIAMLTADAAYTIGAQNNATVTIVDNDQAPADFDGDGKTDIAVYRNGAWFILNSRGGNTVVSWGGAAQDIPVQADYDGDGKNDVAIFRNGIWFILRSSDSMSQVVGWGGAAQDIPVPADYDGDGKADIAIYRSGAWFVLNSGGGVTVVGWGGAAQDVAVPEDYDGDGKADVAVYRDGAWFIIRSSDGGVTFVSWGGLPEDIPVPADYDGDGKADVAVYRDGAWFIIRSSDGGVTFVSWGGLPEDIPVPADYDGDGITDAAVYRNGTWFINKSSGGTQIVGWGEVGDVPIN